MRAIPITLLTCILALYPQNAFAPQGFETENHFAAVYKEWGILREQSVLHPGTINASEVRAWHRVQDQWKILNRYIESQY